jgi:hypothetical protein
MYKQQPTAQLRHLQSQTAQVERDVVCNLDSLLNYRLCQKQLTKGDLLQCGMD